MQALPPNIYFKPENCIVEERRSNKTSSTPISDNMSDRCVVITSGTQSSDVSGSIVRYSEMYVASWEKIANPQFNIEEYYIKDNQKISLLLGSNKKPN